MMRRRSSTVIMLLILTVLLPFIPVVEAQEEYHWVMLDIDSVYGFRGDSFSVTANSSASQVRVRIYDPDDIMIYDKSWDGNTSRNIPVANDAKYGEYRIYGTVDGGGSEQWFTVVRSTGFNPTSFPLNVTHKGVQYTIHRNKTFVMKYEDQSIKFTLPDLPDAVDINAFNNLDIFVVRFTSGVIDIDMSFIRVHQGVKLVINGTSDDQKDFSFKFYSPRQIKRFFDRIEVQPSGVMGRKPGVLMFDWSDMRRAGEHLSYNHTTGVLTVHDVPQSFTLDPTFGKTTKGGTEQDVAGNRQWGTLYTLSENGDVSNISVYVKQSGAATPKIKTYIYSDASPAILLGTSDELTVGGGQDGWMVFTFSPVVSLTAGDYRLTSDQDDNAYLYYDVGAAGQAWLDTNAYGTAETPWTASSTHARTYSIYANYTVAGANNAPVNDACTITNMDDGDNLYSQLRTYTIDYDGHDDDGFADIDYVLANITQDTTVRACFQFDEDTATFSIEAGDGEFELVSGSCANTSSGNNLNLTIAFTVEWDATEEDNCELKTYIVDDEPESDTDTMQTDYCDVITNLVTTFSIDDDRGNLEQSIVASGSITYSGSSEYPPDAEFTSVSVYDSSNNNEGTDSTIVNGAWSVTFTAPASVGNDTYNLFINMADADYTDAEEVSPTDTFITDRVKLLTLQVNSTTQALNQMAWYNCTFELEYDNHAGTSGDSLTLEDSDGNSYVFTWNATGSVFEANHTESINVNRTLNTYASVNEATYGITILNMNGLSVVVQWGTGTPTFTIYIHVTNAQAAAIENATTMVSDYEDDSLEFSQLTNSTGYTDAETMTAGNYTLLVNKEDYQTYSTIFEFDESETVEVQLSALTARGFVLASGFLLALLVIPFGILIWWRR